jgi:F0F1-type ATP synthase membrane subunit b/b'
MEHELSQSDIIINIVVQIVNIALFFFLFIKFAGNAISKALDEKIQKEKKLADADNEYTRLMAEAQFNKERLLEEALFHKQQLISEAKELAHQERLRVLEQANCEAKLIIDKAIQEAELKWRDLDSHFVQGVKTTAYSIIKKLFSSQKDIQESYLNILVDEFTASYKK